jgi:signal peptidase I
MLTGKADVIIRKSIDRSPNEDVKRNVSCLQRTEPLQTGGKTDWQRFFIGKNPAWTLARVLLLILGSFLIIKFVLTPIRVTGNSMEPTCYDGQISVLNVLAYAWHTPKRGDVVGFRSGDGRQIIIKRIIGLPGERIAFHSGAVYINGRSIAEPYLVSLGAWEWPEETLGENIYFVTGDNRVISQQFRVETSKIMGKVFGWHPQK